MPDTPSPSRCNAFSATKRVHTVHQEILPTTSISLLPLLYRSKGYCFKTDPPFVKTRHFKHFYYHDIVLKNLLLLAFNCVNPKTA